MRTSDIAEVFAPLGWMRETFDELSGGDGGSVGVILDATRSGVELPRRLMRQRDVHLELPRDLPRKVTAFALYARLRFREPLWAGAFRRMHFDCVVPWSAVYAVVDVDGRHFVSPGRLLVAPDAYLRWLARFDGRSRETFSVVDSAARALRCRMREREQARQLEIESSCAGEWSPNSPQDAAEIAAMAASRADWRWRRSSLDRLAWLEECGTPEQKREAAKERLRMRIADRRASEALHAT